MKAYNKTTIVGGKEVTFSTGYLAKQASGACTVRCGDTVVLVTAVVSDAPKAGYDFMPLVCDYIEKTYSAGKIPGGFFKREGKPSEKETLTSRLLDRPIRPLFPKGYFHDVQIIASVLSYDLVNDSDVLAMVGASIALELSGAPFKGPVGAVRVGLIGDDIVINPTHEQMTQTRMEIIVAGNEYGITMVEGKAQFVDEATFVKALEAAEAEIRNIVAVQKDMMKDLGIVKKEFALPESAGVVEKYVVDKYRDQFAASFFGTTKQERRLSLGELRTAIAADVAEAHPDVEPLWTKFAMEKAEKVAIRSRIFATKKRIDGRDPDQIRPITCDPGFLPRTHGSAVFTRGETQSLVVTTLGTKADEQKIDALLGESYKRFMLHYNFPPFSTGEVKMLRGPGRREVGHGALAERALIPVLPSEDVFPYTIRIVSDILESNGSSSMASVCGGSLSLMDAGAPIKEHVAGIAMGLMKDGDDFVVLSDILGDEDHIGDMDFKVCGTKDGITAVQMDIKITGLSMQIMSQALDQARRGRLHILGIMNAALPAARPNISIHAPRVFFIKIRTERIRDLIGPGGKNIRGITDATGVEIDINDDGTVRVFSKDAAQAEIAIEMVKRFTFEPEVGAIYTGRVVSIKDFGAFVQLAPGVDGLLHISQISKRRLEKVTDELKEGDEVTVKVLDIDAQGKIKLSRKELLRDADGN